MNRQVLFVLTIAGLLLGATAVASAASAPQAALSRLEEFHGGTLAEDTALPVSESPYVISEDIVVPAGVTLTIEYQDFLCHLPLVLRDYPAPPPLYHVHASPDDLAWLEEDPYRDETIPAAFDYGRAWQVDVRYRGDVSRLMPKKCWKVFFPGSDLFQGQEELNLNADYPDQTLLRSDVGYDFLERAGVPTPRASYARLLVNGRYYGLFSQVEQIDQRFLHRLGTEIHGNLYKPFYGGLHVLDHIEDPEVRDWWYSYRYPKKTNRQSGHEDVVAFIELINYTPDEQFAEAIAEVLDVNEWLDWYAANILLGNFEMMEKNYYLYHDLSTDRWLILPWDVDLTLGHNAGPGGGGYGHLLDEEISWDNPIDSGTQESKKVDGKWNVLIDRMMDVPEFRAFHCRRLQEMMAGSFSPAEMSPCIDAAFAYIRPWAEADPHRWQPEGFRFSDGPEELETYVTNRIQFIEDQMPGFCPAEQVPLAINELMPDNGSTITDEAGETDAWIELYNSSDTLGWDLGGMYLSNDPNDPTRWRVPDDTLIPPGGTLLVWADGEEGEGPLHASFGLSASGGQIGLFDRDVFGNAGISAITYPPQTTDVSYGRVPDGGEPWQFLPAPTPGWLNQGRPPTIGGAARTPSSPTSVDSVTVLALISDDGATLTATLRYRAFAPGVPPPPYGETPMFDDGAHGDGGSGDGIYGARIPPQGDGTWVEYYLEATDEAGMVTVDRPGWPQGDYRYVVGWQRPPITINELMALNTRTLSDESGDTDDWIELYNTGTANVDLGGMYLGDSVGNSTQYTIPVGTVVPAGGTLVLWADGDTDDGAGHLDFKLSGAGEYVGLFDSLARYNAPIDAVYFGPQVPDVSWGRFPDGGSEWHAMDTPTPGSPNRLSPPRFLRVTRTPSWPGSGEGVTVTAAITAGSPIVAATVWVDAGGGFQAMPMVAADGSGTSWQLVLPPQAEGVLVRYYLEATDSLSQRTLHPAAAPAATHRYLVGYAPPAVRINEFLADNASVNRDEAGEYDDWVELYNGSAIAIALDGLYLTDDLAQPHKWQIPAGTTIPPGGYLLVWCDGDTGQGPLHASFRLDRDGEEIGLFDSDAHGNVPLDTVVFGPQREDVSYGRRPDGADGWETLDPPTPGGRNG